MGFTKLAPPGFGGNAVDEILKGGHPSVYLRNVFLNAEFVLCIVWIHLDKGCNAKLRGR